MHNSIVIIFERLTVLACNNIVVSRILYIIDIMIQHPEMEVDESEPVEMRAGKSRYRYVSWAKRKYHSFEPMPCLLCPKDRPHVTVRNWKRHCNEVHKDFIKFRSSAVSNTD